MAPTTRIAPAEDLVRGARRRGPRMLATLLLMTTGLTAGCVSAPEDAGFSEVNALAVERTGYRTAWTRGAEEDAAVNAAVAELLSDELLLEEAVQVAVLNNRNLQATFEQLGIARAELIQAGLPRNPVFTGEWRLFDPGPTIFEGVLVEDLISVITIPLRRQIQGNQFEAVKREVAAALVHLVGDVKRAYALYQADKQLVELLQAAVQATKGSYMVAARLREAGNTPQIEVLRRRAAYEAAKVELNAAVEQLARAREQLNALLGLWGAQTMWETPARLPEVPVAAAPPAAPAGLAGIEPGKPATEPPEAEPPAEAAVTPGQLPRPVRPPTVEAGDALPESLAETLAGPPVDELLSAPAPEVLGVTGAEPASEALAVDGLVEPSAERFERVERLAVARNLELAAARELIEAEAGRLKLDPILAAFPFLNAGVTSLRNPGLPDDWGVGPAVNTPVPVFDFGQAQVTEEIARLRQRLERYAALATEVRAIARAAEARLQATRARALYLREVVLPVNTALVAEAQLQYNAVQITPFELIQAKLLQIAAAQQYIAALLEYWLARSELEEVLDGALPAGVLAHGVAVAPRGAAAAGGAAGGVLAGPLGGMEGMGR